jgi:hypothetical protein
MEYQLRLRLAFQLYQYSNFHQELLDLCAQTFFSVDLLWIECMSAVLTGARSAIGTAWSNSTRLCRGPLSKKQTALQKSWRPLQPKSIWRIS